MKTNSRIALVMNSSFLGCPGHAGFLNALEAGGMYPGKLSGASAGAIVAGLRGSGVMGEDLQEACVSQKVRNAFVEWHRVAVIPLILSQIRGYSGLSSGRKALAHFRALAQEQDLAECPDHEVALAVTNLTNCLCEMKAAGPIGDFIVASCAFPGLVNSIDIGGDSFWDGGIGNVVPYEHWLEDPEIETIIIHHVEGEMKAPRNKRFHLMDGFSRSHWAVSKALARLRKEKAEAAGKRILSFTTLCRTPRLWSTKDAEACYEAGRMTGEAASF